MRSVEFYNSIEGKAELVAALLEVRE